jgi:hypothetical protein
VQSWEWEGCSAKFNPDARAATDPSIRPLLRYPLDMRHSRCAPEMHIPESDLHREGEKLRDMVRLSMAGQCRKADLTANAKL